MPKRTVTVEILSDVDEDDYTDVANAICMFMRSTPRDFQIAPDRRADLGRLNSAWEQYGKDAQWTA